MEIMLDYVDNCFLDEYMGDDSFDMISRRESWKIAIGLQDVDALTVSPYLIETAREHIEGRIDMAEAMLRIQEYHKTHVESPDTIEADIVSVRIVDILGERSFSLSPAELCRIHERLFEGIYYHAGKYRDCNIAKREWVLDGDTVLYSPHEIIAATLDYDFRNERSFSYDIPLMEVSHHIASFISGIWQIHPFGEGNTRTSAVFLIRYLRYLGLDFNGDCLADNSRYFRNALVRANYLNRRKGITGSMKFLHLFFDNLLSGSRHELRNRYMHVDYSSEGSGNAEGTCIDRVRQ